SEHVSAVPLVARPAGRPGGVGAGRRELAGADLLRAIHSWATRRGLISFFDPVCQGRPCEGRLGLDGLVTPIRACGLAGGQVARGMKKISYKGYRFPLEVIQQAIWIYVRYTLSIRDVKDLLAERGIMVSYETVRRWVNHFGPMIAANLRKRRPKPY